MDQTNPFDPRFGRFPSSGNTIAGGNSSTVSPSPSPSPSASAVGVQHDPISYSTTPPPPARGGHHRRAHSENFLRISEDFLFESDNDFSLADIDFPSFSDENGRNSGGLFPPNSAAEVACKKESEEKGKRKSSERPTSGAHLRSLSVDTALFEGLGLSEQGGGITGSGNGEGGGGGMGNIVRHRHSSSMDGLNSPFEAESPEPMDYTKKAMAADKLAELALLDPKRAKRILANRQSAARSKERKIRYTSELERKVQTLQTEATTLSAQLTLLQRDTSELTTENKELKLRLQAMEQQAHLREALNQALRDEVQRLKIATGQIPALNNGNGVQHQMPQNYFAYPHQHQHQNQHQNQHQHQHQHQHGDGGQAPVDSMDFM